MCHNRPDMTRETVVSVLEQADQDFKFVISDNSSNDEVEQLVKSEFPFLNYVRHKPMTLDHIGLCMRSAVTDYVCVFHDDDLLKNNFVTEVKKAIHESPEAVAIGCNAFIEEYGVLNKHPSFMALNKKVKITTPHQLASRYFSRHQLGIAPFPSYVYKRNSALLSPLDTNSGKHADVAWLLSLLKLGPIIWINQKLMTYRIHGDNDGLLESRRDRLKLLQFIKRNLSWLGVDIIEDYRCSFVYKPLIRSTQILGYNVNRCNVASLFLHYYSCRRYSRLSTYTNAIYRAWVKAIA